MGRNLTPKLGEWRDDECYSFIVQAKPHASPDPNSGDLIVYQREFRVDGKLKRDVLCCAWADGIQSVMATMYAEGYRKGVRDGKVQKLVEIQAALGVKT